MNTNLKKLEFNKILDMLCTYCVTYMGKNLAMQLLPSNSIETVQSLLKETEEAVNLIYRNSTPTFYEIENIDVEIKHLESNTTLSCKSLLNLKNIFKLSQELKEYFSKDFLDVSEYPILSGIFNNLYSFNWIASTNCPCKQGRSDLISPLEQSFDTFSIMLS